jgi:hypothetical protein
MFHRSAGIGFAVFAAGCQAPDELPAAPRAEFDPATFFSGRTQGTGSLNALFRRPVMVAVESFGRPQGETLILNQSIRKGDKPPRFRRWTMQRLGPNRYSGSITGVAGPVDVEVSGSRARIRYNMKGGLKVDQHLALQNDGRTVLNRLRVMKFGLQVAVLNETIRKLH